MVPVIDEEVQVVDGGRERKKRKKGEEGMMELEGKEKRRRNGVGTNVVYA